jgi:hypothetical protein
MMYGRDAIKIAFMDDDHAGSELGCLNHRCQPSRFAALVVSSLRAYLQPPLMSPMHQA